MEVLFEKKRTIPHNKCMATAGRSQGECAKTSEQVRKTEMYKVGNKTQ